MDTRLHVQDMSVATRHTQRSVSPENADDVTDARCRLKASGIDEPDPNDVQPFRMDLVTQYPGARKGLSWFAMPFILDELLHGLELLSGKYRPQPDTPEQDPPRSHEGTK